MNTIVVVAGAQHSVKTKDSVTKDTRKSREKSADKTNNDRHWRTRPKSPQRNHARWPFFSQIQRKILLSFSPSFTYTLKQQPKHRPWTPNAAKCIEHSERERARAREREREKGGGNQLHTKAGGKKDTEKRSVNRSESGTSATATNATAEKKSANERSSSRAPAHTNTHKCALATRRDKEREREREKSGQPAPLPLVSLWLGHLSNEVPSTYPIRYTNQDTNRDTSSSIHEFKGWTSNSDLKGRGFVLILVLLWMSLSLSLSLSSCSSTEKLWY